jgi:predicted nuclease with TOPRIM domain
VAEKTGKSRNDFLESLLQGNNPFIETVQPQPQPLIETVETDREVNDVNIKKQPDSESFPLRETARAEVDSLRHELEAVRAENQGLHIQLGNLQVENEALTKKIQKLLSALELPFASDLLNQLKAKRKKSTASLADIEAILEIIEES